MVISKSNNSTQQGYINSLVESYIQKTPTSGVAELGYDSAKNAIALNHDFPVCKELEHQRI